MDGGVKRFVYFLLMLQVVLCPTESLAESARCIKLRKIDSPEEGRAFYAFPECRDTALERVTSYLPSQETRLAEIAQFLELTDPLSTKARYQLLSILLKDSPQKAFEEYASIKQLDPQFFSEVQEAEILIQVGKLQQATRILDKLISAHPGNLEARRLRAVAHFEAKNFNEATSDLQFFLDGDSESAPYQLAASKTFFKLGMKDKARRLLEETDLERITDQTQLIAFGSLAESLGEITLAENGYRALNDENAEASILLARVLQKQGKLIDAREILMRAKDKFPGNDFLLAEIIQDHFEQGKLSIAARLLEQWQEKYPEKIWIANRLNGLKQRFAVRKIEDGNLRRKPDKAERVPASKNTKESRNFRYVSVRKGESLMSVSFRLFGTHQRWRDILRANKDRISSPNQIPTGMKLKVPDSSEEDFE